MKELHDSLKPLPDLKTLKSFWNKKTIAEIMDIGLQFQLDLDPRLDYSVFVKEAAAYIESVGGITHDFRVIFTQGYQNVVAILDFHPSIKN